MKLFTTKAFRARFAECAVCAENEVVYIKRPGDRLGPDTERELKN